MTGSCGIIRCRRRAVVGLWCLLCGAAVAGRRVRRWVRWKWQGSPTDVPVVVELGVIFVAPNGHRLVTAWTWDFYYVTAGPLDGELFTDYLALRYPQTVRPS